MWEVVGIDGPSNSKVYAVFSQNISDWIKEQPRNMWNFYEIPLGLDNKVSLKVFLADNYLFTKEMELLFLLRWS